MATSGISRYSPPGMLSTVSRNEDIAPSPRVPWSISVMKLTKL